MCRTKPKIVQFGNDAGDFLQSGNGIGYLRNSSSVYSRICEQYCTSINSKFSSFTLISIVVKVYNQLGVLYDFDF